MPQNLAASVPPGTKRIQWGASNGLGRGLRGAKMGVSENRGP